MASYILIHGAWHASWCWEKVAPLLSGSGHQVLTPDLPGHGENNKPYSEVEFQDYLDCIMNEVSKCDEMPILVGHSFAGIIMTQLAANFPDQFQKLVYLAAYVPLVGDSLLNMSRKFCETGLSPELIIDKKDGNIQLKTDRLAELLYHCAAREDQDWAKSLIIPEPLAPLAATVNYSDYSYSDVESLYIFCEQDRAITMPDQLWMAERTHGETVRLQSDHCPFLGMPEQLVSLLV